MSRRPTRAAKRATRSDPRMDKNVVVLHPEDDYEERYKPRKKKIELKPRGLRQHQYVTMLEDPDMHIILASGPAGTGKTMLATLAALKGLQDGWYDKIIITRPNVAVEDRDIGHLPGDILAKMGPWVRPLTDIFMKHFSKMHLERMIQEETIELSPLAFMRGRSFERAFIIADETQNCSADTMKMLLTRIGDGCKLVVTGDENQHDRHDQHNGLTDAVRRLDGVPGIGVIKFTNVDIERHPVIAQVLKAYGE